MFLALFQSRCCSLNFSLKISQTFSVCLNLGLSLPPAISVTLSTSDSLYYSSFLFLTYQVCVCVFFGEIILSHIITYFSLTDALCKDQRCRLTCASYKMSIISNSFLFTGNSVIPKLLKMFWGFRKKTAFLFCHIISCVLLHCYCSLVLW